jgi:uncharacterized membrane protein
MWARHKLKQATRIFMFLNFLCFGGNLIEPEGSTEQQKLMLPIIMQQMQTATAEKAASSSSSSAEKATAEKAAAEKAAEEAAAIEKANAEKTKAETDAVKKKNTLPKVFTLQSGRWKCTIMGQRLHNNMLLGRSI